MRFRNVPAFSVAELMVSVTIIVLLALAVVFSLNTSNRSEELRAAARELAADMRLAQSRAFSAQNIQACTVGGDRAACQSPANRCGALPCVATVPDGFGIHFSYGSSSYVIFADLNPAVSDSRYTDDKEMVAVRTLLSAGAGQVTDQGIVFVDAISVNGHTDQPWADLTFRRQSGTARLAIPDLSMPTPTVLTIRLKHRISQATATVEINTVTGRVSVL